jgi:hypothetical protein
MTMSSSAFENHGKPIAPSELASLFDPLRRGPEHAPEEGSLGLGLFICGEVAKAHGGQDRGDFERRDNRIQRPVAAGSRYVAGRHACRGPVCSEAARLSA